MKLPNTDRGFPVGDPNVNWSLEQLVAYLRNQHKVLTAPDGKVRRAVAATDEDIAEIAADIARLEREIFLNKTKLN